MKDIEDIIEFENENTSLDFKAKQYIKGNYESFLKDIISLANGKSLNRKLIIVGIKHLPNGEKDILGIDDSFIDDATYQQLVHENIEPEIQLTYSPYFYKNKNLGIFELFDCLDKPYMMKKDFRNLKRGDSYIRKGSHQTRVTRKDIDYFFQKKIEEKSFDGQVNINFQESGQKEIALQCISTIQYPSQIAEEKIQKILTEKEKKIKKQNGIPSLLFDQDYLQIGGTPYKNLSIKTLKEKLKTVKQDYAKHDLHYLLEVRSNRLNFTINNIANEYIEDASIKFIIEKSENLLIARKIIDRPQSKNWILDTNKIPLEPSWERMNYPEVIETETEYEIFENIGDLKHLIQIDAFNVPIRIVVHPEGIGKSIIVKAFLYGKNLQKPITEKLIIKIVE